MTSCLPALVRPGIGATFYGDLPRDLPRNRAVIAACDLVCLHTRVDASDALSADLVRAVNPAARVWLATPGNYLSKLDREKGRAAVVEECERMATVALTTRLELLEVNGEGASDGAASRDDWTSPRNDPREKERLESLAVLVFETLRATLDRLNGQHVALGWTSHDDTRSFAIPRKMLQRGDILHGPQHYPADRGMVVTQRILERRIQWSRGRWEALADTGAVPASVAPYGDRWAPYLQGHGHSVGALVWGLCEAPVARLWACPGSWSPEGLEALILARRLRARYGHGPDAVERAQAALGLDVDGIVGDETEGALRALV